MCFLATLVAFVLTIAMLGSALSDHEVKNASDISKITEQFTKIKKTVQIQNHMNEKNNKKTKTAQFEWFLIIRAHCALHIIFNWVTRTN